MAYIVATRAGNERSRVYSNLATARGVATRRNRAFYGKDYDSQKTSQCYEVFEKVEAGWAELGLPQNVILA